jgi:hypothetical protein
MSTDDYRHIHHIISAKPLPLLDPNESNDAIHYTQTIDDENVVKRKINFLKFRAFFFKTVRNPRLLHRRVHLNDLPDYLISGASKQLILHRTRSPSTSSVSQYDDNSGFFAIEQDETPRSFTAVPHKRYHDNDELSYSNKRHVITERVIPVQHQRAKVIHEEKPTVGKIRVGFD